MLSDLLTQVIYLDDYVVDLDVPQASKETLQFQIVKVEKHVNMIVDEVENAFKQ